MSELQHEASALAADQSASRQGDMVSEEVTVTTPTEEFDQYVKALGRIHQTGGQASLLFAMTGALQEEISLLSKDIASGELALEGISPANMVHLQRAEAWIASMLTGIQARLEGLEVLRGDLHRQLHTSTSASETPPSNHVKGQDSNAA